MKGPVYLRTFPMPHGSAPDLGRLQESARLLGLEVVKIEFDASGEKGSAEWLPRWHVYLTPFAFEEVS